MKSESEPKNVERKPMLASFGVFFHFQAFSLSSQGAHQNSFSM